MQQNYDDPVSEMPLEDEARLSEEELQIQLEEQKRAEAERKVRIADLAHKKHTELERRKRLRSGLEKEWIDAEYAFNGEYTDEQRKELVGTKIFRNITRAKTVSFASHISDILMPTDDKCFGIQPTPIPVIGRSIKDTTPVGMTPEGAPVQMRDIAKGISEAAKEAAKKMQTLIEDQFAECNYNKEFREAIFYGAKYGTIIMRGPTKAVARACNWTKQDGAWVLAPDSHAGKIGYEAVNPFHFYPDPVARCIEDSEENYETFFWPGMRLRAAAKTGYDTEAIQEVLASESAPTPPSWRIDLDQITNETQATHTQNNLYEVWRWQGRLQGQEAVDFFGDKSAEMESVPAVIWGIGPNVIKWEMSPTELGEMPYSVCQFIRNESSIFGHGIPWAGRHEQESLNSAWRMVIDNGAMSAVPSAVVMKELLHPADGNWEMRPKKIWYGRRDKETGQIPDARALIQWLDHPVKLDQLLAIEQRCREHYDETIMFSLVMQGEAGRYAPDTARATEIHNNNGRTALKNLITDIDDNITKPNVRRVYNWNMEHAEDDSVKGDMQVVAKGSSVLLERAEQVQTILAMMNVFADPRYSHKINDDEVIEILLKNARLHNVLLDEEKSEEKKKMMQQSQGQVQSDPARMKLAEVAQGRLELDARVAQQKIQLEEAYLQKALEELGMTREQFMAKYGFDRMKLDSDNQKFNVEAQMKVQTGRGI